MYKCLEEIKRLKWGFDLTNKERIYLCECIEKELANKEQLEKAFDTLSKENEKVMKELSKEIEKNRALEIIKDRLIVEDKGGYIQVVCEFSIPRKSKKYKLLKEVLL